MSERDQQSAVKADQAHLLHPLHHPSGHTAPKIWVKGRGSILTDLEGKEYFDGLSGLWNVNVGHGRKELARAAQTQMESLAYASAYTGCSNLPAIELAERISELCYPNINTFFFTSGGGESTESAIKTSRYYWKRRGKPGKWKVISRKLGYHGVTLAAMSATGIEGYWKMFEPRTPGFIHIPSPYPYYFNPGVTASQSAPTPGIAAANLLEEAILREGAENIAAFLAEPVQGAGGVIVPQDDYFTRVREICDKYEVLLISDEVITGFGRTGRWFALEHWDVQPDMICFAKGVTSGYLPLGGIGISDEIKEAIDTAELSDRYMHAFTYSGHPTTTSVALANLDYIERHGLVEKAAEMGRHLLESLKRLESHPHVGEARGLGMMAALEIVEDKESRKEFDRALKTGERIHAATAERGLWSRTREDVYCLAPPLTTTASEIDRMVEILAQSISATLGD